MLAGAPPISDRNVGLPHMPLTALVRPLVRPILEPDFAAWKPLWDGYNAFYGRHGATALADEISHITWQKIDFIAPDVNLNPSGMG